MASRVRSDPPQSLPLPCVRWRYPTGVKDVSMSQLVVPDAGFEPWRTFVHYDGQEHLSGEYWSSTMTGMVVYESQLELKRARLADFDPDVIRIHAQPFQILSRIAGRVRHHVPDFLLVKANGLPLVVNVKPAHRLEDEKVRFTFDWVGELLARYGWPMEVWSGESRVRTENLRFLASYRRPDIVDASDVERAFREVRDGETVASAEHRIGGGLPGHVARPPLMRLLWTGRLRTDLDVQLGGQSPLWRNA
ncbi:TnsA-like heteromeric transposase endonuclease subunit [Streptomyces griseofuscus]|uniref:TnsA-like heteromeric transposase endonuclease subunit n=1 Tax=Streptomyces griseofuscus TaxID=146922 RepID=UPI003455BB9B